MNGARPVNISFQNASYCWNALSTVLPAKKDYDGALKAAKKTVELADDAIKSYHQKNMEKIKAAQAADKK